MSVEKKRAFTLTPLSQLFGGGVLGASSTLNP